MGRLKKEAEDQKTYITQPANPPLGVQENFHYFHPVNISVANQPVLVSPNAMAITANQVPLNTTPPNISSQYGLNAAYVGRSGNFSEGFQASNYPFSAATGTSQLIPASLNGMTLFTTPGPINNSPGPAMAVAQNRPNAAFANQGATFPYGSHAYSNSGVPHLNGTQGISNQQIYLRPNGGGVVPQYQGFGYGNPGYYGANHGMMDGVTGMAIGGLASGFGEAAGGEMFQWVTDGLDGGGSGGGGEGLMGLDGSEIMNSYAGDYFGP